MSCSFRRLNSGWPGLNHLRSAGDISMVPENEPGGLLEFEIGAGAEFV
jgi:hypothetical protein